MSLTLLVWNVLHFFGVRQFFRFEHISARNTVDKRKAKNKPATYKFSPTNKIANSYNYYVTVCIEFLLVRFYVQRLKTKDTFNLKQLNVNNSS